MILYKAARVITGAIKRTSHDKLYQDLGLESLIDRRWSHRLFFFHKITQRLLPSSLQTYRNAVSEGAYLTRSTTQNKIKPIAAKCLTIYFFHIALRNGVNSVIIITK